MAYRKMVISAPEIVWLGVFLLFYFNVDVCLGARSTIFSSKTSQKKESFFVLVAL